jgi:hypothetical protein
VTWVTPTFFVERLVHGPSDQSTGRTAQMSVALDGDRAKRTGGAK